MFIIDNIVPHSAAAVNRIYTLCLKHSDSSVLIFQPTAEKDAKAHPSVLPPTGCRGNLQG